MSLDPILPRYEDEVVLARRSFATAQAGLAAYGAPRLIEQSVEASWHAEATHEERGSFAVVREGGALTGLVGEVLRVSSAAGSVFVYCVAARDIPDELSLYRRAFLAIGGLFVETVDVAIEVVE